MTAMKKEQLEELEAKYGLSPDGLSYQHRCSRITAYLKGEEWVPPKKGRARKEMNKPTTSDVSQHPLYGKTILITPLMRPDAKRNLAFDEDLGPVLEVRDFQAGERIYNEPESVTQMVGDYEIVRRDVTKHTIAKTTFPKIGTEITFTIGRDLVPVVRGNDGKTGFIWSFPTQVIQIGDTLIQLYGLKTLIQQVFPQLISKFSGKPIMDYIDGVTLAANIPLTKALLMEETRKERIDARAGIEW